MKNLLILFCFSITLFSCIKEGAKQEFKYYTNEELATIQKDLNLPPFPNDYTLKTPDYISNTFFAAPPNNDLVTLGRVLFYDKNLSNDKSVSCGSCHDQKLAFSDNKAFSDGSDGKVTSRNSLALGSVINFSVYYGDERFGRVPFFWDNSAISVQEQSERTLANPNEMNMHLSTAVSRVNDLPYYKPLISKATSSNTTKANDMLILDAIASFVNSIPAYNTKWDQELSNHFKKHNSTLNLKDYTFEGYSAQENKGLQIYFTKCAGCHGETIGSPAQTRANNGLTETYTDNGIGKVSGASKDMGLFKVPTLRNILLTAPYMHDGSLSTIDDVLDHYSTGIKPHANLDKLLKTDQGNPKKMNLSKEDREALKVFFETLTDNKLVVDNRFSDPFK